MVFSCFRPAAGHRVGQLGDEALQAPRPVSAKSRILRREGSDRSRVSSTSSKSNESISRLPPCKRSSDPKIEAMMMPLPHDARPSRCLRLSHPKTYSALVSDMKASKGCRDWRSFAVFYEDDVDSNVSAEAVARKRALDYERKLRQLNSFSSGEDSFRSIDSDLIG